MKFYNEIINEYINFINDKPNDEKIIRRQRNSSFSFGDENINTPNWFSFVQTFYKIWGENLVVSNILCRIDFLNELEVKRKEKVLIKETKHFPSIITIWLKKSSFLKFKKQIFNLWKELSIQDWDNDDIDLRKIIKTNLKELEIEDI